MGVQAKPISGNKWVLLLAILAVLGYTKFKQSTADSTLDRSHQFILSQLNDEPIHYSKHALCRMDCRQISKQEVNEILKAGKVNWTKSNTEDKPCPSYALEGKTSDGQTVRIVFADCSSKTTVITAIDLDNEYQCYCD